MNYSTSVMLVNDNIRAIKGKYEETGNIETFKTVNQEVKVDDLIVVESGTRWNYTIVKVTEVDVDVDFDDTKVVRWCVCPVDMTEHNRIKAMEEKAIDLIKRGELRKRRENIRKNTLDAMSSEELGKLEIARLGAPKAVDPDDLPF